MIAFFVGLVSGIAAAAIAGAKGLNRTPYFLLGFFLPLLGVLVAGFMPARTKDRAESAREQLVGAEPLAESDDEWIALLRDVRDDGSSHVLDTHRDSFIDMMHRLHVSPDGEWIVAYGFGYWDKASPGPFLLTDRRLVLYDSGHQNRSVWIETASDVKADWAALLAPGIRIALPKKHNVFRPKELAALAAQPDTAAAWIEVSPSLDTSTEQSKALSELDDLERLADLYREGLISRDEFDSMKRAMLEREE